MLRGVCTGRRSPSAEGLHATSSRPPCRRRDTHAYSPMPIPIVDCDPCGCGQSSCSASWLACVRLIRRNLLMDFVGLHVPHALLHPSNTSLHRLRQTAEVEHLSLPLSRRCLSSLARLRHLRCRDRLTDHRNPKETISTAPAPCNSLSSDLL
jgi:hypothetical protein